MKEPILKNCCCCCDLKVGCCIYVGISLIVSIIDLLKTIGNIGKIKLTDYYDYEYGYTYRRSDGYFDMEWVKYLSIAICIITIITCILFFKGVSSKKPDLLKPFVFAQYICLAVIIIAILFMSPFLGDATFLVLFIAAIPIGINAYLITCVYSLYVIMKYGPEISVGHAYVPQVIVQSQPQSYQPQYVYYTANPTASSYPQSSYPQGSYPQSTAPYPPNIYASEPYNPNFYQPTTYGPNSSPPNYTAAVNNSTNFNDEKPPLKY